MYGLNILAAEVTLATIEWTLINNSNASNSITVHQEPSLPPTVVVPSPSLFVLTLHTPRKQAVIGPIILAPSKEIET